MAKDVVVPREKSIDETGSKWDAYKKSEVDIEVYNLEIDHDVQREHMNEAKILRFVRGWNPAAVGRILVSRRRDGSYRVLDGMHRVEAWRRLSDGVGVIPCEVYEGLTIEQEAELFLDKNSGDRPTVLDRYRVAVRAGLPVAVQVDELIHAYGWTVSKYGSKGSEGAGDGVMNAVAALQKLYRFSEERGHDPNLLQWALIVIGRVWGNERAAGQGFMVTAIGRMFGEYGEKINIDRLCDQLRNYKGGLIQLIAAARQQATTKNWALPMATADLIVETYNKGLGERNALPRWRRRT